MSRSVRLTLLRPLPTPQFGAGAQRPGRHVSSAQAAENAKTEERFGVLVDNLKKIGLRYKTMINELRSGRLSSVPTSVGVPLKQVRAWRVAHVHACICV